jgi:hypothetical protein
VDRVKRVDTVERVVDVVREPDVERENWTDGLESDEVQFT